MPNKGCNFGDIQCKKCGIIHKVADGFKGHTRGPLPCIKCGKIHIRSWNEGLTRSTNKKVDEMYLGRASPGKSLDPEIEKIRRNKISKTRKRLIAEGKILGQEVRDKIAKTVKEQIKQNGHPFLGKHHSEKTKDVLREARLKQVFPLEDTKPEVELQNALNKEGIEFQKHYPIPGQPDIFIGSNLCIFVDGCYWHGKPGAKEKDAKVTEKLSKDGYIVLRFSDKEIFENISNIISKIKEVIPNGIQC